MVSNFYLTVSYTGVKSILNFNQSCFSCDLNIIICLIPLESCAFPFNCRVVAITYEPQTMKLDQMTGQNDLSSIISLHLMSFLLILKSGVLETQWGYAYTNMRYNFGLTTGTN